jgi:tetratricopeptide (TPR) repeat protein
VLQLLADTLVDWGLAEDARPLYETLLERDPDDARALGGLVRAHSAVRDHDATIGAVEHALALHGEDDAVVAVCADALAGIHRPTAAAVERMAALFGAHDELHSLGEALARAQDGDPAAVEATLLAFLNRLESHPVGYGSDEGQQRSQLLVRAARTARSNHLADLARELNTLALRLAPGAITLYRDLAFIELEEGHLEVARRYLEVLSFVDLNDRESAMALAELDFRQLGQPTRAADVVRRTFPGTLPPAAIEILAAEAYLLGRPIEAINKFRSIAESPLITADTYRSVARIAYASALDEVARLLYETALLAYPQDAPQRARIEWILNGPLRDVVVTGNADA